MDGHESKVACGFPFCQGSGVTHLVNRTEILTMMGLSGFDAELQLCVCSYSSSLNPVPVVLWETLLLDSVCSELDKGILKSSQRGSVFPAVRLPVGAEPSPADARRYRCLPRAAFPRGEPEQGSSCSSGRKSQR